MEGTQYIIKAVEKYKYELKSSNWTKKFLNCLRMFSPEIKEIRCLALGQLSEFMTPRFQLALLIIIMEEFNVSKVTSWDPVYSKTDLEILKHYNIQLVRSKRLHRPGDFYYVIHGPMTLNKQLIQRIGGAVFMGNNFNDLYVKNNDELSCFKEHKFLPINVQRQERWFTAFNSTALYAANKGGTTN